MDAMALADARTHEVVDGVHLTQLAAGARMSIQHYHFEPGATVPEHSHDHEQAGYLVRGTLTFDREDTAPVVASDGESYVIPPGEPHRVANEGDDPAEGIDIFSPPRTDPNWGD